ncbi:VOC family protein [Mucilaginibacter terrenus]|uniref:VOC family protein n=1 Tax=Mucilaginibacter terrenus TaxID=2482727 RepID=A0A3E2NR91_9SPHI|nr:VOC family protein [Mucilaginibacter terrenus]RFZ83507.1 VOC family protein [Mucilaginibacter terrenus]
MLADAKTFSSFSVDDIEAAKKFYAGALGLKVDQDEQMGNILTVHLSGGHFIVYPKPNHTPATFTVLNFVVDNIDEAVNQLKEKGVNFESYDSEYLKTDDNNIFRGDGGFKGPSIAWFTDPAGNILSVIEDKSGS